MRRSIVIPIIFIMYAATVFLNTSFKNNIVSTNQEQDIIEKVFGGLRGYVGDWAFMKAEEYHHNGLPFMKAVAYHKGQTFLAEEEHGKTHVHEEEMPEESPKNLYSKIYSNVNITKDAHLNPGEEKEVLPWFYMEVRFNPNDIRGYVLGGYWLERMGKTEEALKFLKEGEGNNPESASIKASIGEIYYRANRLDDSASYTEQARVLWREGEFPNAISDQREVNDRNFALDMLGNIYEKLGDKDKALGVYAELYRYWPKDIVLDKIKRLKGTI